MDGEEDAYSEEEFVEEDDASSTRSMTPAAEDAGVPHVSPSGSHNAGEGAASPQGSHATPERDATPPGAEVAAVLASSSQGSCSILPGAPLHAGVDANEKEGGEGGSTGDRGGLHAARVGSVFKHASMPSLGAPAAGMEQEAQASPGRPGGNPEANVWFLESTPIQMPPESGGIVGD